MDDENARSAAWAQAAADILLAVAALGLFWLLHQRWSWMAFLALGLFLMFGLPLIAMRLARRTTRRRDRHR